LKEIKQDPKQNTSVSAGYAKALFDSGELQVDTVVIYNFGTGAFKVQKYQKTDTDSVVLLEEIKASKGKGKSPSDISIGTYTPKNSYTSEAFVAKCREQYDPSQEAVPRYALVTGTIRGHWENTQGEVAKADLGKELLHVLRQYDAGVQVLSRKGDTYEHPFISQADEAMYEYMAVSSIVKMLTEKAELLFTVGIGRGSFQMGYKSLDSDTIMMTGGQEGMGTPDSVFNTCQPTDPLPGRNIMDVAMSTVSREIPIGDCAMSPYTEVIIRCDQIVRAGRIPIIGLKSGALLYYDLKNRVR
jgi:hypothetical protein